MTLLDANVLLYAYNADAPEHERARRWLEGVFASPEWVGLAWMTIWAFLRISTNHRLFPRPLSVREACGLVDQWLSLPRIRVVEPGTRHGELLKRLMSEHQAAGPLVMDAALASLAIEYGATLASTDQDFRRFPELCWINPLADAPRHPIG